MASIRFTGTCSICGGGFRKSEMKNHLDKCQKEEDLKANPYEGAKKVRMFRIYVKSENKDQKEYWLNLEAPEDEMKYFNYLKELEQQEKILREKELMEEEDEPQF